MEQETNKQPEHKRRKRRHRLSGRQIPLLLAGCVLAIYLIAQIANAFFVQIQTTPALHVEVNDSFYATGWFFRDETPVSGIQSDTVQHIVYSGERVQQDAPLAVVYTDEQSLTLSQSLQALDDQIELFNTALQSAADGSDAAKLDQLLTMQLRQMADQLKDGTGQALAANTETIRTLSLRRSASSLDTVTITAARDSLITQRNSLEQQLAGHSTQIVAPSSGYFSEVVDGYESILTPNKLDELTLDSFHELIRQPEQSTQAETLGKVIQGFQWYLAIELPRENAEYLRKRMQAYEQQGQTPDFSVSFTQASIEAPVSIDRLDIPEEGDTALLIVEGSDFSSELVSMRNQQIEFIMGTYSGLKVPKEAVRMVTDSNGNEVPGVYILSGAVTYAKTITKLYEADTFYVVKQTATDAASLVEKDQIVIRGKDLQDKMVVKI